MSGQAVSEHISQTSFVGRFWKDGEVEFLPMSRQDHTRATDAAVRCIATFEFPRGKFVLAIQLGEDAAQMGPVEDAFSEMGFIITNADNSVFDAYRTESITRRFEPAAVVGISAAVLDGLASLGHDAAKLFRGKVVWCRADAYARVAAMPDVIARQWISIGPALGMGCVTGHGMHVDGREWSVTIQAGELKLTSRLPRARPFEGFATGVKGTVDPAPCPCGSTDPIILVDL